LLVVRRVLPEQIAVLHRRLLNADSEEKHEPVSDIDTAVMEGLKALDPNRPIREADMCSAIADVR
jgi:hypothetical protein